MSYGGSSLIVCCMAIGLLMRIHYETSGVVKQASKKSAKQKPARNRSVKQNNRYKSGSSAVKNTGGALL
jgi:hypothetical protein